MWAVEYILDLFSRANGDYLDVSLWMMAIEFVIECGTAQPHLVCSSSVPGISTHLTLLHVSRTLHNLSSPAHNTVHIYAHVCLEDLSTTSNQNHVGELGEARQMLENAVVCDPLVIPE